MKQNYSLGNQRGFPICAFSTRFRRIICLRNCSIEQSGIKDDYMKMPYLKCVGNSEQQAEESRKVGAKVRDKFKSKEKKKDNTKERKKGSRQYMM